MKTKLCAILLVPSILSGCALFSRYGHQAAQPESERAIPARPSTPAPLKGQPLTLEKTRTMALALFNRLYYAGGYAWATQRYKPGDFTRWESAEGGIRYEKAFLRREAEGKEWWRVRETGDSEEVVFEALLTPPDSTGMQQILSLRAQLPGQEQLVAVMIPERERARWQLKPAGRLSWASMTFSMMGWEPVKTKAGLFKARHVRHFSQDTQVDWWLSDEVPGGIVKYSTRPAKAAKATQMLLTRFGPGATQLEAKSLRP